MGLGHGTALIRAHVKRLLGEGAPAIGVDPHPDNARAIHVYEKAGFEGDAVVETDWGRYRLMVYWPDLSAN